MRIAMIHTPFCRRAGGERQILKLAIELQEIGHDVNIFTNAINLSSYPEFFEHVAINLIPHPLSGKLPPGLTPQIATTKVNQRILEQAKKPPLLREWMRSIVGRQYYTSEVPSMPNLGRKRAR